MIINDKKLEKILESVLTKVLSSLDEMVKKAVAEALTAEMTWEQIRDEKTGQPLAVPERKTEKVLLPAFIVQLIPYLEGAIRGNQEQMCKLDSNVMKGVGAIADILLSLEGNIKQISHEATKQIEFTEDSKLAKLEGIIKSEEASEAEREKALEQWKNITGVDYVQSNT